MSKTTELARIARIVLDEVFVPGAEHELKKQQVVTKNGTGEVVHKSAVSYAIAGLSAATNARTRLNFMQLTGAVKVVRTSTVPFTHECLTLVIPNGTSAETIVVMIDAFKEFMDSAKKFGSLDSSTTVSMNYGKPLNI